MKHVAEQLVVMIIMNRYNNDDNDTNNHATNKHVNHIDNDNDNTTCVNTNHNDNGGEGSRPHDHDIRAHASGVVAIFRVDLGQVLVYRQFP